MAAEIIARLKKKKQHINYGYCNIIRIIDCGNSYFNQCLICGR